MGNLDELYAIAATGEALNCPLPTKPATTSARPDIVYLPLHDAPRLRWSPVWRTGAETDLIRAFAKSSVT
ncbi:hypothetical protein [Streptomyces sp. HUAS TT7]|uniref:hypothetical protein n=1 Tax=Streptomyces sp. HUAS TT7 TaxID=3447507 RepID=UPI003F65B218